MSEQKPFVTFRQEGHIGVVTLELHGAAAEVDPDLLLHGARATIAQGRRELPLPQVAGLEDVVVDRDDVRQVGFGGRDWRHGRLR